jgi:autotransporter-associated beta strand protein
MNKKQLHKSPRSLAVIIPAVFVCLAMARLAGAATPVQITPLQFDGGNGSTSADQYPGNQGAGNWNQWKTNTAGGGTVTPTVVNTTPFSYGSGGNYLSVTYAGSTSGQAIERQFYQASGSGQAMPATYTITWKFRMDSSGLMASQSDYFRFLEQNTTTYADMSGGSTTLWLITAFGAADGNAVANTWAFYNGGKDNGGFNASLLVNTGIPLVQGHVYTFTVVETPSTSSWVGKVLDNNTGNSYTSGTLGYRMNTTAVQGYLYWVARQSSGNPVISLDDVSVGVVASHSTVSPATATAPADGTTTKTITVQARDYNNTNITVGGESVVFSTTAGTVSAATDNNNGTYTATWTAPSSVGSGTATVTATLGGGNVGTAVSASSTVITLQALAGPTLFWTGGNGIWDVNNSANWKNSAGTTGLVYTNGAPVTLDDTATGTSPIAVSLNTTVNPTNVTVNLTNKNYTISGTGAIAGPIGLTLNGSGTLTLATTNTYSGGTINNGGILEVDATGALGSGLLAMSGGVLSNNVSATLTNSVNLGSDTTFGVGSGQTLTLGGVISNSTTHALTKTGAGTLTLGTNNTYTGNTTVNAGTLRLVSPGGIYSATYSGSTVTVNSGGVIEFDKWGTYATTSPFGELDFGSSHLVVNGGTLRSVAAAGTSDNRSCTIGSLGGTLDSSVANHLWTIAWASAQPAIPLSGPLTLTGAGNGEIDQNITNSGSVVMNGTGTWTLKGTNTYSGVTTVSAGTLLVNGSITSAVTNQSGATFGGTGTVTGDVGFGSGAFALFNNSAALTINGNLILNGNTVNLNLSNNVPAGTYTLATFSGTASGSFAGTPTILSGSIANGSTPSVSISGNSVLLTVSKVTPTAVLTVINSPVTYSGLAQTATVVTNSSSVPGTVSNVKYDGSATAPIAAGAYVVTADFTPNDTVNYNTLTTQSAGSFTIDPKAASVTADNQSKTYGAANPPLTATVAGTVNGDVLNYTLATDAAQFSSVGTSNITVTLGSNPNYSVLATNSTLTIGAKAASVTANNASKNYGQTVAFAGTEFTSSGLVGGDTVASVTLTSSGATNTASVGSYPIVASAATGTGLGNYNLSYTNGTLTVNAATPVTLNSPVPLPDGNFLLNFTGGDTGVSYQIQASTDLSSPTWIILATNMATLSGIPSYTDTDATNHPIRFYRTVVP